MFAKQGNQVRAGTDLLFGQQDHLRTKDPRAVKFRDAAIVTEGGRERCRVPAGAKIKIVCVGICQVNVTSMSAFDAFWCSGSTAGIEQGRDRLFGRAQP